VKGKNKLYPCLFGVCKESVMRVDEKSKKVFTFTFFSKPIFLSNERCLKSNHNKV